MLLCTLWPKGYLTDVDLAPWLTMIGLMRLRFLAMLVGTNFGLVGYKFVYHKASVTQKQRVCRMV